MRLRPQSTASQDNRLSFTDQTMFLGVQATGQDSVMQGVWIYEHPVDFDALERVHQNFGYGLLGRRIERSPLPFGRHRWVASLGAPSPIRFAAAPRPRSEVGDWADECTQVHLDPERGPGWEMAVLPLTDGSTAISLVGSHCLVDGGGAALTMFDAVNGVRRDFGFPPPRSRSLLQAARIDGWETVRSLPEVGRALVAAIRLAFSRRHELGAARTAKPTAVAIGGGESRFVEPTATVFVDCAAWDARAAALGATSPTLVAAFAAKLAERAGRTHPDTGKVCLLVPIGDRGLGDTGANAVSLVTVRVDPGKVTADLSGARAAIRAAIDAARVQPDETLQLLPLAPFIPKRAVRGGANAMFGFVSDRPVSCSNLGELDAAIGRPDGSDAEYLIIRGMDQNITRHDLEAKGGLLTLVSGRVGGKISLAVIAYLPGAPNTKDSVQQMVRDTLAEFDLAGVYI